MGGGSNNEKKNLDAVVFHTIRFNLLLWHKRRIPYHQIALNGHRTSGNIFLGVFNFLDQIVHRRFSDLGSRLVHRGQGRMHNGRVDGVAKAHHRNFIWDLHFKLVQGLDHSYGRTVRNGKNSVGAFLLRLNRAWAITLPFLKEMSSVLRIIFSSIGRLCSFKALK